METFLEKCPNTILQPLYFLWFVSYPKHIENVHLLVSLKGEDGLPGPKGAKGIPGDPVSKSKHIVNT